LSTAIILSIPWSKYRSTTLMFHFRSIGPGAGLLGPYVTAALAAWAPNWALAAPLVPGDLYVATSSGDVLQVTPGGVAATYATFSIPLAVAFDPGGDLFVLDGTGPIWKFTPTGTLSAFAGSFAGVASGLATDFDGNVYVSNGQNGGKSISAYDPAGEVLSRPGLLGGLLNMPQGMAFDAAGNLFVANAGDNTIVKITPSGVQSVFASGFTKVSGLAIDSSGNLLVADEFTNGIVVVSPGGVETVNGGFVLEALNLAINASGDVFVDGGSPGIFEVDPYTNVPSTRFGPVSAGEGSLAFDNIQPTPEPPSLALFAAGLVGLAACLRCRRGVEGVAIPGHEPVRTADLSR
jgi:DNA-binding beta-propeller fold protein YncE